MKTLFKSLLSEYGLKWTFNRSLYFAKLKMMTIIPVTEKIFEKEVQVNRIDIFDFDTLLIQDFLRTLSKEKKEEIISIADKAIEGVITGFSSIELNYGNPINWHLNPLTGVECRKDIKWYRIPDFDAELGDIKVIWEASRLTHFFYFTRAYLITEDKKYYYAFSEQLKNWLNNNIYSYGPNYKCGQECTLRMINALMAYSIFKDCGLVTDNDEIRIKKLVEDSYKKVLSNFFYAHKCIKNNHTFSEILGLIVGAWCCENEDAVKEAYRLLDDEIKKQFLSDGGFTQYSFNYHRFTLQILECVYKISEKTGTNITENERIKNSILLMYQVQAEDGDVPNYGSNDGALIFPVTSCSYRDFRPVLNTSYALLEGKRLYEPGDYDEELLWFGGRDKIDFLNVPRKSSNFHKSGFYILRHRNGFIMTCLQEYKSRPAHMDQLHIDLWHKGVNILCDSGTYSYASEIGNQLSGTEGHNIVKLDGIDQMNKRGTFLVTDWTKRQNVKFSKESFSGTMISQNGYSHTRTINKTGYGYMILDEVIGDKESCTFLFHTPCEVKITTEGIKLFDKGELICTVLTAGTIDVKKTYRSLYYLKKEEINCIHVQGKMQNGKCNMTFEIHLVN